MAYPDAQDADAQDADAQDADVVRLARTLDEAQDLSWPALLRERHGGWELRAAAGVTRRANSVWPRGPVGDLEEALCTAEAFYERAGLRPTVQVSPAAEPVRLHHLLDAHGWSVEGRTDVAVLSLPAAVDVTADGAGHVTAGGNAAGLAVAEAPDGPWLDVLAAVDSSAGARRDVAEQILARVELPSAFVRHPDGAVGRGVLHDGRLGILNMATLPAGRRRGLAREVLDALLGWAAERGATGAWLQVQQANTAAQAFYTGVGFRAAYSYVYRRRPGGS